MRKIICALLALLLCCSLAVSAFAVSGSRFLYDDADLLTQGQEAILTQKLADISGKYDAQIVIATLPSVNGSNIDYLLDYLYDTMGFGYGENHDGILLLVCMDVREYRILSNGYAGVAIDASDIGYIGDAIVSDLSDGYYADAFHTFADECDYYLNGYINGYPYDPGFWAIASLIVGALVALIAVLIMKSKLKSVRWQNQARNYIKPGSMKVTLQEDIYLYRTVTRTKREKESSSGSGGTARSKGGGSF